MKLRCPYCNYLQTHHELLEGKETPKDGDISFCIECGEASEFKNEKTIKVNEQELDEETRKEFIRIRNAWLKVKARQSVMKKMVRI